MRHKQRALSVLRSVNGVKKIQAISVKAWASRQSLFGIFHTHSYGWAIDFGGPVLHTKSWVKDGILNIHVVDRVEYSGAVYPRGFTCRTAMPQWEERRLEKFLRKALAFFLNKIKVRTVSSNEAVNKTLKQNFR